MKVYPIDDVLIPFDPQWSKIAISLSGGADSALLAYLVSSLSTNQKIYIINHIRMWKTRPWQQFVADNVYNYLKNKFSNLEFEIRKNFIAPDIEYGNIGPCLTDEYGKKVSGDNIQQRAFAEFVCHTENINAYFNAITRNPRVTYIQGMKERDIEFNEDNKHLEFMIHMNKVVSHPFRFVDKSWIISQYKKLKILDLLELTRSCEGDFSNIDYESYIPGQFVPICNHCFWCKEKKWALQCHNISLK